LISQEHQKDNPKRHNSAANKYFQTSQWQLGLTSLKLYHVLSYLQMQSITICVGNHAYV